MILNHQITLLLLLLQMDIQVLIVSLHAYLAIECRLYVISVGFYLASKTLKTCTSGGRVDHEVARVVGRTANSLHNSCHPLIGVYAIPSKG